MTKTKMTKKKLGSTPKLKTGFSKKILTIFAVLGLSSMSVLGAWILSIDTSITGNVVSDSEGVVYITTDFTPLGTIDTTNTSVSVNQTAIIHNENGNLNFLLSLNETREDVVDGCTDYENDITISYELNGASVQDGDNVTITSGDNNLVATFDFAFQSCPQNVTVDLGMIQV